MAITLPNFPTAPPEPTQAPTPAGEGIYAPLGVAPGGAEQATPAACGLDDIEACVLNEIALNLDYLYSEQDFVTEGEGFRDVRASSEVNSTALRLEYVPLPFVSLYFLGVRHDGVGKPAGLNLDGWGWGTGITGFLPIPYTFATEQLTATPFSITDFNYTYNDFHDIESGVDVYSATQRLALGLRGKESWLAKSGLTVFGGASFQDRPTRQRIRGLGEIRISPDDTWIPVVGVVLSYFGKNQYARPRVSLSIEGGWGDRDQVSLSLRYETHAQ